MKLDTQAIWNGFEKKVIPVGAGEIQKSEMRMAFMAGMGIGSIAVHKFSKDDQGQKTSALDDESKEILMSINEASAEYAQGVPNIEIYQKHKRMKDGN